MKWWPPWKKHIESEPESDVRLDEARAKEAEASEILNRVNGEWHATHDVTEKLRRLRERNHFADLIDRGLR